MQQEDGYSNHLMPKDFISGYLKTKPPHNKTTALKGRLFFVAERFIC